MSVKKPLLAVIASSIIAAFSSTVAFAEDSTTEPTSSAAAGELAAHYSGFAGSEANATALVNGLRTGESITLSSDEGSTVTFTSATPKLGYGDVNIALSLAQAELTKLGISDPTPEQLEAALNGGTITTSSDTAELPGVLRLRSEGKGWGQIAKSRGFKLGEVVSASKSDKSAVAAEKKLFAHKDKSLAKQEKAEVGQQAAVDRLAKAERPEKAERAEKIDRPEKLERLAKVERRERPERPQR